MNIPENLNKQELFDYLKLNKDLLIAEKKSAIKKADMIAVNIISDITTKALLSDDEDNENQIIRKLVINTTNIIDSHKDVHINGLWNKTLKENKNIMFLQEHEMEFSKVIADYSDLKCYTKLFSWKELGYNFFGNTEAVIFEAKIKSKRNEFMYNQYRNNFVKNHSVGMQYVKIDLALNDVNSVEEYKTWNKYINEIANKEVALENGYFWAVQEAKLIEGSAVVIGSNQFTPVLIENKSENNENITKLVETLISKLENIKPFNTLNNSITVKPLTNYNENLNKMYNLFNNL